MIVLYSTMKRLVLISIVFFSSSLPCYGQIENVFLITLDGLRWEELYTGADPWLLDQKKYSSNPDRLKQDYWHDDPKQRRQLLMPFFWSTIKDEGQLYGNRNLGSQVDLTNDQVFSYPGYNEILTGFADSSITSNDKVPNKNTTVLEWVNQQDGFEGKVAAFASWDVFPYIINEERSGIPVNAGFDSAVGDLNEREIFLNQLQSETPSPWSSVRLDVFTHHFALEHIKKYRPRLVYIAYGETDDFAHDGDYDQYLDAANRTDTFINDLWRWVQSQQEYRDKTAFVITVDHGRGEKDQWTGHGIKIDGASSIWLAMMGPGIEALGEVSGGEVKYQNQVAATVAGLLGLSYKGDKIGKSILK